MFFDIINEGFEFTNEKCGVGNRMQALWFQGKQLAWVPFILVFYIKLVHNALQKVQMLVCFVEVELVPQSTLLLLFEMLLLELIGIFIIVRISEQVHPRLGSLVHFVLSIQVS